MATHPSQQLTLLALGLAALAILALAIYVLYRSNRPRLTVVPARRPRVAGAHVRAVVSERPAPRRRVLGTTIALALLLCVFAGKYLVRASHPSGDGAPDLSPAKLTMVRGASGAQLSVAHYGAPEGQGPTLLFTHGWGADRRDWLYAIRDLPPGLSVVAWDLPGLGESSRPANDDYSMSTLARDLDSVLSSLGDRPVILVGHSIGGILNLEYARQFPAKLGSSVRGIVQANTTFTNPVETKKNAELSRKLQEPVFRPLLHLIAWTAPIARTVGWLAYQSGLAHLQLASQSFAGAQTWEQLDEMARYAYRSSPAVVSRGVLAMLDWDGSSVLPQITVPTLIISGDQDVTTLPWASDKMAHDIRSSQRVAVSPAAHLGPVEQHKRYADAIASFAARAGGPASTTLASRLE